jgi:hypothetical protein
LPFRILGNAALFFDPARRIEYRRVFSTQDYLPPLGIIKTWLPHSPHLGVKLSPGVNWQELREYTDLGAEVEFISVRGDLKEAVLWFGDLARTRRRATLLPGGHTLTATIMESDRLPISIPRAYLYEPDPSILRAGLVTDFGMQINACQLDPDIAYLTGDTYHATPFGRVWQILDWFPFQLKRLRSYLRAQNVGEVIIKKRGSPLEPEALMHDLRLSGSEKRTLFLTHLKGKPIVIIGDIQEWRSTHPTDEST